MHESEMLYPHNSVAIVVTLFFVIILFNEIGFRIGRFIQAHTDSEIKALTGSIQASILGLLALLLGFTFSMAMQRFDGRSMALIDEANAIGTGILRAELLPQPYESDARRLLRDYLDLRIAAGQVDITRHEERRQYDRQVADLQQALWQLGLQAAEADPRPLTSGAFVTSLNAIIDAQGKRSALLAMHVPESVLLLLFVVFVSAGGMMGYSGGLSGKRMVAPVVLVSLLITLIVFLIIDLDRPRRGLIQVDQEALTELRLSAFG